MSINTPNVGGKKVLSRVYDERLSREWIRRRHFILRIVMGDGGQDVK